MSPRLRYAAGAVTSLLFLTAGALLVASWRANDRLNPGVVEMPGVDYLVVRNSSPGAVTFELFHPDGGVAASIRGITSASCTPPYLMVLDVDQDGVRDVYYSRCGGHGYVTYRNGGLVDVELGQVDVNDAPAAFSFWANEIRTGGRRLRTMGALLILLANSGLAFVLWLRRTGNQAQQAR